jgi:hypothetical protein
MESIVQEIRYSVRSLATRPMVAVVAVLSLSLAAIGVYGVVAHAVTAAHP